MDSPQTRDALTHAIHEAAHHLPDQGPIHVFVHHNTLHALQHLPFHEALREGHAIHGAAGYLSDERFRDAIARGRIDRRDLERALTRELGEHAVDAPRLAVGCTRFDLHAAILVHGLPTFTRPSAEYALGEAREHTRLRRDLAPADADDLVARQLSYAAEVLDSTGVGRTFGEIVELLTGVAVRAKARAFVGAEEHGPPMTARLRPTDRRPDRETDSASAATLADGTERALRAAEHRVIADVLADLFGIEPTVDALRALIRAGDRRIAMSSLFGAARAASASIERRADEAAAPARDLLSRVGVDRTHLEAVASFARRDPRELVHGALIPLAASFLDDGFAMVAMPHRERGFYEAARAHVELAPLAMPSWAKRVAPRFRSYARDDLDALGVVSRALEELGVEPAHWEPYLRRVLLELPGYAGMFGRLERNPAELRFGARPVRVVDFLAVKLTFDLSVLEAEARETLGFRGPLCGLVEALERRGRPGIDDERSPLEPALTLFHACQIVGIDATRLDGHAAAELLTTIASFDPWVRRRVYQRAYELHYARDVVAALRANASRAPRDAASERASLQIFTCIDDREESLRRHLEERIPDASTFGVAGFFGVAIAYRGLDDAAPTPLCPVVVTPRHEIVELPRADHASIATRRARRRALLGRAEFELGRRARFGLTGALLAPSLGLLSIVSMASRLWAPRLTARLVKKLRQRLFPRLPTQLTPPRPDGAAAPPGELVAGFTLDEKVDRVFDTLENVGLVRGFAPVVAIIGHGSASSNNPHFSAYDCGACGGRHGYANARLFARMANRPEVRARLRARGVDIPDDTVFVGALHNTADDSLEVAPVEGREITIAQRRAVDEAFEAIAAACASSAHERCRRFALAPRRMTVARAKAHVERRVASLAEPRPELGHVTNASCVVGRRALTQDVFLDRRAFLVSYDATLDDDARILERVLAAVTPVGAGISLEYYFSTVDNDRYGAGTKLPHNPTAHLGVMEGAMSDLRTGLPKQMIEIHEPMRLLLVVEATGPALLTVLARQPVVAELVENAWVSMMAIDPHTRAVSAFEPDRGFVPFEPERYDVPFVARSLDWYDGRLDHLPAALIARPSAVASEGGSSNGGARAA